jgi:hypothetical protein
VFWLKVEVFWLKVEVFWLKVEAFWLKVEAFWLKVEVFWLKVEVLGKGRVQQQAIDELEALPENNPLRSKAINLLV